MGNEIILIWEHKLKLNICSLISFATRSIGAFSKRTESLSSQGPKEHGVPMSPKRGISESQKSDGFGTNPTFAWDFSGTFCFLLLDDGIQAKLQANISKREPVHGLVHLRDVGVDVEVWNLDDVDTGENRLQGSLYGDHDGTRIHQSIANC